MDNAPLDKRTPYEVSTPRYSVLPYMVTSAFELPGYRITQNLGIVRGIVVRSLSIIGTLGSTIRTLVGGNIIGWTRLCEQTRREAFEIMIQHATELNANAIIGARYDATEIATGATEVLAYGTAVIVEPTETRSIYDS